MGTLSVIRVNHAKIKAVSPIQTDEVDKLMAEFNQRLAEIDVKAEITLSSETKDALDLVEIFTNKHKGLNIDYFLKFERIDSHTLSIKSRENSGKAYDFDDSLVEFASYLDEHSYTLSGTFYREGEELGDLEMFVVENNKLVKTDTARLMFSDGSFYDEVKW